MAQGNTYRFISDGGHGWAEIPTTAVLAAGIRPSRYSYYDPASGMTYLEEDCDVGRFLDATANPDQGFTDVYVPGDCWVRDLPRWSQYTNDTDLGLTSTANHTAIFQGYGGMAVEYETACYAYRGEQIRIPLHPEIFPPEEVAVEYGVFSEAELRLAVERIDELAEEFPEDYD